MFGKRSDQPRTSDDRARAAAERAARRAGRPLPAEAFEHSVRPPDIEPHEPLHHDDPEPEAPRFAAPVEDAHVDPPARREETERHVEPDPVVAPEETPDREEPAARNGTPEREVAPPPREEPAARNGTPEREVAPPPREEPAARNGTPEREVTPPPAETQDDDEFDFPSRERPREDVIHQPTVEYTPFQTDEHQLPEPPLGSPHEDEPRLVAARGFPHDADADADPAEDEIHAYATPSARGETADHDLPIETGEHAAAEEIEPRPPTPLRRAPARPADAAPRRRPAPNAPRGRARAPKRPKTPKGPRSSGTAHWGRRIFAVVALIVFLGVLYVANATFQPFHGDGEGDVAVTIPANSDAGEVGTILAEKGVIDSARYFELKATISGDRGDLRPGRYTLKKGMTNGAAIEQLVAVPETPQAAETVSLTIVEGPSRKENAPVVDGSKKLEGDYARASSSKATLRRIRDLGAPKGTKSAEGFLFPATYEMKVGSTADDLVEQQLDAFEQNFKEVDMRSAKRKNLTRYDVLIIASMIEREAQLARERALVSAVIYNRLKDGMPLGIDATIRYATNNWQRPIRQSELDKPGPYNSRLNRDLPPTPIGNPGLASIKAAAKPSSKNYLYYVRKPGKSGEHAFSTTDAQFQRDVAKYQASREG